MYSDIEFPNQLFSEADLNLVDNQGLKQKLINLRGLLRLQLGLGLVMFGIGVASGFDYRN